MNKKKDMRVMFFISLLFLKVNLTAYNINLAQKLNGTFSQYSQKYLNNSKILVSSDEDMRMLQKKEKLDKLPIDKPIIVVCHSGSRALQAATNLAILGFKNTKVLYGGIIALAKSNSIRNAPVE